MTIPTIALVVYATWASQLGLAAVRQAIPPKPAAPAAPEVLPAKEPYLLKCEVYAIADDGTRTTLSRPQLMLSLGRETRASVGTLRPDGSVLERRTVRAKLLKEIKSTAHLEFSTSTEVEGQTHASDPVNFIVDRGETVELQAEAKTADGQGWGLTIRWPEK